MRADAARGAPIRDLASNSPGAQHSSASPDWAWQVSNSSGRLRGMEPSILMAWTLQQEIPVPPDVLPLLVEGEQAVTSFKTFRDSATFTTKRLIVRDAQGMTGKKVEIYSLPYSSINMWSSENAGKLDWNSEIELWTKAGHIKVKLAKGADVRRIDSLIAWAVLNTH
jgi:hypothetical protein